MRAPDEGTQAQYREKARGLLRRFEGETGRRWREDPDSIAQWFHTQCPRWARRTARLYRNALGFYLEQAGFPQATRAVQEVDLSVCPAKSRNTSGPKKRSVPKRDLDRVLRSCQVGASSWDVLTGLWLYYTVKLGLRPCEWKGARLDPEGQWLLVPNAKATNGRSHGRFRTLNLADWDPQELQSLQQFLHYLDGCESFEKAYSACRRRLWAITRRLWPRRKHHVTLYSGRHQLTADAKSHGKSLAEVAAMLGHASDETATVHYGRRTQGRGLLRAGPNPEETARIRPRYKPRSLSRLDGDPFPTP